MKLFIIYHNPPSCNQFTLLFIKTVKKQSKKYIFMIIVYRRTGAFLSRICISGKVNKTGPGTKKTDGTTLPGLSPASFLNRDYRSLISAFHISSNRLSDLTPVLYLPFRPFFSFFPVSSFSFFSPMIRRPFRMWPLAFPACLPPRLRGRLRRWR